MKKYFPYMTDQLKDGECDNCFCFHGVDSDGPICSSTLCPEIGKCTKDSTRPPSSSPVKNMLPLTNGQKSRIAFGEGKWSLS